MSTFGPSKHFVLLMCEPRLTVGTLTDCVSRACVDGGYAASRVTGRVYAASRVAGRG